MAGTPTVFRSQTISITASLGLAVADEQTTTDFNVMYELAAAALNEAKRNGRNRFVVRNVEASLTSA